MEVPVELVRELQNLTESLVEGKQEASPARDGRSLLGLCPVFLILLMVVLRVSWTLYRSFGQKTRSPQARRMYGAGAGPRPRASLSPDPTIYVSPNNLPPPPKYECMAPPSYEEVVGIHYPNYQPQPITQPLSVALAHSSNTTTRSTTSTVVATTVNETAPAAPTVAEARRASVTAVR